MGLSVSHDAYDGGYVSFGVWREYVALAAGIKLYGMEGYGGKKRWNVVDEGLRIILNHADNEGEISTKDCKKVADSLQELMIKIKDKDHRATTKKFIEGCLKAYDLGEPLIFG